MNNLRNRTLSFPNIELDDSVSQVLLFLLNLFIFCTLNNKFNPCFVVTTYMNKILTWYFCAGIMSENLANIWLIPDRRSMESMRRSLHQTFNAVIPYLMSAAVKQTLPLLQCSVIVVVSNVVSLSPYTHIHSYTQHIHSTYTAHTHIQTETHNTTTIAPTVRRTQFATLLPHNYSPSSLLTPSRRPMFSFLHLFFSVHSLKRFNFFLQRFHPFFEIIDKSF